MLRLFQAYDTKAMLGTTILAVSEAPTVELSLYAAFHEGHPGILGKLGDLSFGLPEKWLRGSVEADPSGPKYRNIGLYTWTPHVCKIMSF